MRWKIDAIVNENVDSKVEANMDIIIYAKLSTNCGETKVDAKMDTNLEPKKDANLDEL